MQIKLDKKVVEKILTDELNNQRKRIDNLNITNAKTKKECEKRQESIMKAEILEVLFLKLGITNEITKSSDYLNEIKIV